MKRNVLKFDDIKGMLSRDEMKGVLGGCGGGSGTYYGGQLNEVVITPGGGGGYYTGGYWPGGGGYTGGSNPAPPGGYGTGYSVGGTGGGNAAPTQDEANSKKLYDIMQALFQTEISNKLLVMTGSTSNVIPVGYTLNSDGSYHLTAGPVDQAPVYGVTVKSGELTFVYISPFVMNKVTPESQPGIIQHELLHAQHIQENGDMYTNNFRQFSLNSELAAYTSQMYFASVQNDQATVKGCSDQINSLIAQGATGGFSTQLYRN